MAKLDQKLDEAVKHLKSELSNFHTGRADTSLVADLQIEVYGDNMRVEEIASLSVPEPDQIVIKPWDKENLQPIERAINKSDMGFTAGIQSEVVRINIPPLSEERREEIAKLVNEKLEEAKVAIRNIRREEMQEIDEQEDSGEIGEDTAERERQKVQEKIDEAEKQVEDLAEAKKEEIREE